MLDKRLSTCLLLLVLCLAVPVLPLHAAPTRHPVRLAGANRGDGHPDIAVGVPGEDIGDAAADAGAVNVFYSDRYGIRDVYNQM